MDFNVIPYQDFDMALESIRARYAVAEFDVTTKDGMKQARAARAEIRKARTDLEKVRQELKKPAIEYGRRLDSEARRITQELEEIEAPIDDLIRKEEARIAREKAEAEAAEAKRIAGIRAAIDMMKAPVLMTDSLERLELRRQTLMAADVSGPEWGEFLAEAMDARASGLVAVEQGIVAVQERARQEAELAALKAEAEERRRQEQAAIDAAEQSLRGAGILDESQFAIEAYAPQENAQMAIDQMEGVAELPTATQRVEAVNVDTCDRAAAPRDGSRITFADEMEAFSAGVIGYEEALCKLAALARMVEALDDAVTQRQPISRVEAILVGMKTALDTLKLRSFRSEDVPNPSGHGTERQCSVIFTIGRPKERG